MIGAMTTGGVDGPARGRADGGAGEAPDDRLVEAARLRHEAAALHTRLEAATAHADGTTLRVQEARDRLSAEERDVDRLGSVSWSRILSSLKGAHATDLEREQAERDAARYSLVDAQARADAAWRDVEALQVRLEALGDVEAAYASALAAKERWAATHDPELTRLLTEIAERRALLLAEDREAREAHAAGTRARDHLLEAHHRLGSASSWSTWDTFGGGGMFTDLMKYDQLDQVGDALRRADAALGAFTREMADLRLAGVDAVNLDGMTQTFDVFFDNIFTDLRVRSRIQDAGRRVAQALNKVDLAMQDLSTRGRQIADELTGLAAQRDRALST
jgi:hypothetical protein